MIGGTHLSPPSIFLSMGWGLVSKKCSLGVHIVLLSFQNLTNVGEIVWGWNIFWEGSSLSCVHTSAFLPCSAQREGAECWGLSHPALKVCKSEDF